MKSMTRTRLLLILLFLAASVYSKNSNTCNEEPVKKKLSPCEALYVPEGWSFDLGGSYTWISFTTPPSYTGSTGGIETRMSYQKPKEFFGQIRSIYNIGPLSSSLNDADFSEWYSEFLGGYCISILKDWTFTIYAGLGLDFLHENNSDTPSLAPIQLRYNLYYAIAGFDTHYNWKDWMFGVQLDCLPTFNQYLKIASLSESAWILDNRVGAAVHIPIAYRYVRNFWLELAPYYRFLPIGNSSFLQLPERNLNQWGAFLRFRFFL
jgi:hypothetical protein